MQMIDPVPPLVYNSPIHLSPWRRLSLPQLDSLFIRTSIICAERCCGADTRRDSVVLCYPCRYVETVLESDGLVADGSVRSLELLMNLTSRFVGYGSRFCGCYSMSGALTAEA